MFHQSLLEVLGQFVEFKVQLNRADRFLSLSPGSLLRFFAPNGFPTVAIFRRSHTGEIAVMYFLSAADSGVEIEANDDRS